jgi:hypothetical protein
LLLILNTNSKCEVYLIVMLNNYFLNLFFIVAQGDVAEK